MTSAPLPSPSSHRRRRPPRCAFFLPDDAIAGAERIHPTRTDRAGGPSIPLRSTDPAVSTQIH